MANGFQVDAPRVGFASPVTGAGEPDTSRANLISTIGGFAGEVRREQLSSGLRRSFGRLAEQTAQLQATPAEDINVEEMTPAELENLSAAERSFRRLRIARKQGRISEAQVQIEAEKILQDTIQAAPGFENDFRRLAASTLGFDPTGATVQTLLGAATTVPDSPTTKFDEWNQMGAQVEQFTGGAITREMWVQNNIEDQFFTSRKDARKAQAEIGDINADRFISQSVQDGVRQSAKEWTLTGLFQRDEETGALSPKDSVDQAKMQASLAAEKQRLLDQTIADAQEAGVVLSTEKLTELRNQIDAQFAPIEQVAEDLDTAERLSRNWGIIKNTYGINAYKAYKDVALAQELGIQREYFELLKTPEQYRKLLSSFDPSLGPAFDLQEQGRAEMNDLQSLISGALDLSNPRNRGINTQYTDTLVNRNDAETQRMGLEHLFSNDKPTYTLSHLAKPGYSKAEINPNNQPLVRQEANLRIKTFLKSKPEEQIAENIRQLRESGANVELLLDGNRLRVRASRTPRNNAAFRTTVALEERAQRMLDKLNTIEAVAENGWGSDLDDWSPSFLNDYRTRILENVNQENDGEQ